MPRHIALPAALVALALAGCQAAPPAEETAGIPPDARPGSIVYSDTWKPGWRFDPDDGRYYRIVPPR